MEFGRLFGSGLNMQDFKGLRRLRFCRTYTPGPVRRITVDKLLQPRNCSLAIAMVVLQAKGVSFRD